MRRLREIVVLLCVTLVGLTARTQQLGPPVINQNSGVYSSDINVQITHGVPGVSIYYTLDGSEPTQSDNLYTGSIVVTDITTAPNNISEVPTNPSLFYPFGTYSANRADSRGWLPPYTTCYKFTVIRAKAFKAGYTPSEIETRSFVVDHSGGPNFQFPVLSLVVDSLDFFSDETGIYVYGDHPDGNYEQKGPAWERILHFDLFDDQGNSIHQQDVRVRMHGGGSRHSAKKNLRLYGEYPANNNFNFTDPLFENSEQEKFKRLLIRAGGHRPDCLPRDDLANLITEGLNADQQHFKMVSLFINGEYWGVHSIKERVDQYFFQNLFGVDDNDISVLDQEFDLQGGGSPTDSIEMDGLESFVMTYDMTDPVNYQFVADRVDIDNYIDYMCGEIFLSNVDWVYSNVVMWRKTGGYDASLPPGHNGKFRWCYYDFDGAFGGSCDHAYYTVNTLEDATIETGLYSSYTRFFRGMLSSPIFKKKFINRMSDLMNSWFRGDVVKSKMNTLQQAIDPDIMANIERWRYPSTADNLIDRQFEVPNTHRWDTTWTLLNKFASRRARKIREHVIDKWSYPDTSFVTLDVNDVQMGRVKMNSILINELTPGVDPSLYPWTGNYFDSLEIPIAAVPLPGYRFVEWQGTGITDDTIYWTPDGDTSFTAVFDIDNSYEPVVINEVMPSNSAYLEDNFQENDDWLELFNPNGQPINLSGCTLAKDGAIWVIPNGTVLEAGGYKLFWHDEETYQGDDHANFKLTNIVDTVYLKSPNGQTIDSLPYPATTTDKSYGRYPNGSNSFITFDSPTPRANNDWTGIEEPVNEPLFVYPNPTSSKVYVSEPINYKVFDLAGRIVMSGSNAMQIDVSTLESSVYLIIDDEGRRTKIVKK